MNEYDWTTTTNGTERTEPCAAAETEAHNLRTALRQSQTAGYGTGPLTTRS